MMKSSLTHKPTSRLWILASLVIAHQARQHAKEWQLDICGGGIDNCKEHRRVYGTNTNNWGNFLAVLLQQNLTGNNSSVGMTDSGGTTRTFGILKTSVFFNDASANDIQAFVQLGTGSTAATRNDYVLQTPIAGTAVVTNVYSSSLGTVTLTGTITYGSAQTPSECALYWNIVDQTPAQRQVMLDHSVFSALASNTTFTIQYTITLG